MIDVPDYYTILGVGRDATRQEISHAYRALMRSHHPDMEGRQAYGDKQEDELLRIMQAFNVLHDPVRRADYDRKLAAAAPIMIPVRKIRGIGAQSGPIIRVTPVRWESGPWS
ncbi:J domain-containing protein [Arthrobacter liuii]|uniref:J domain-containing protein n=1 Tax=Arthrobacter liuii TaxID=1476996 RepID=A0ABQ2AW53_9MICC|nr:J domain-containing protein [Arthrobacter liuii]GGH99730.1 hypothetical protein GCM10007170_35230 [Arthrobacter liuii]